MEAAFELPIQSSTGSRTTPVNQLAATTAAPPLPHTRTAPPRTSQSPKRIPPVSLAGSRPRLGPASQLGRAGDSSGPAADAPAPSALLSALSAAPAQTPGPSSGGSLRELKLRRGIPPRPETERQTTGVRGTIGRPKIRNPPQPAPKPLLPLTERKSQEENKLDRLAKKDKDASDIDKWDIAPDGSSAGREGRQFTVSNVGNNGRIYLRPTVRPAHLRFPQPNFVFPITPPATAGLDLLAHDRERRGADMQRRPSQPQEPLLPIQHTTHEQQHDRPPFRHPLPPPLEASRVLSGSDWMTDLSPSPTTIPLTRPRFTTKNTSRSGNSTRPTTAGAVGARPGGGHRRAVSDSTIHDTSIARESEPGGFKIIISQPNDDVHRARTLEDLDRVRLGPKTPHLEISIPSWKIGSPHFTMRGSPIFQGSSYAPTEEPRSSRPSYFSPVFAHARSARDDNGLISPRQNIFQQQKRTEFGIPTPVASPGFHLDDPARGMRLTYHSNYVVVEPSMFDDLTFKPACDDRSIVRFSPINSAITAATPSRLVAEITSPTFMDYDLVSDFFLTYRAFLEPHDLLRMLVARLRWAVARDDETGMVVRVRTFVALRHWILNYFMDDFVIDYPLRILFCTLLNSFVDELSNSPKGRKVQLKILTELKKCWRRSCAQYWDSEDFDDVLGPDVPISPGGIAGHRNPALDPTFWEQVMSGELPDDDDDNGSTFLTHLQSPESMVSPEPGSSFNATGGRSGQIDSIVMGERPATPESQARPSEVSERRQASPVSISSMDFVSCSFPTKNMRMLQASMGPSLGAHPAEPSLTHSSSGPVAMTPRALVGKRVRPSDSQKSSTTQSQQHRRNNSLSGSIREQASAAENIMQKNTELLLSLPYAGSLVRGNIFPPGQPYVEVPPPGTSGGMSRQTTIFQPFPSESVTSQKEKASAMSSQGMRKLLGSVRRAISTRGQNPSPAMGGNFINIPPPGPRDATTNRLPGTAIVPQARSRMNGFRAPVRIDLLGARIAEDFKIAVREDEFPDEAKAQAEEETAAMPTPSLPELGLNLPQYRNLAEASNYSDSIFLGWIPGGKDSLVRPMSDAGITTGSKSIVIVDGTLPLDFPAMSGALPDRNSSVEMFGDTFLSVAADPTPPTTPPGLPTETVERSSNVLGRAPLQSSLSMGPLPPFIPDLDTLGASSVADDIMTPSSDILADEPRSVTQPRRASGDGATTTESVAGTSITEKMKATNSFGMPSSPLSRVRRPSWAYGHFRHGSSRSHRSNRSYGLRRAASFSSVAVPRSDARSIGASTFDDGLVDESKEDEVLQPARILRRRPGGDLRAATNIGDLDYGPLRRSHSLGSLTTYSESIRSSFKPSRARGSDGFVDVVSVGSSHEKETAPDNTFSVGMITDKKPNRHLSLFSVHTSKPIMRPSFEAEAQKLAQIPDDDDDGGVESALLKLEGKYERKPKTLSFSDPPHTVRPPAAGKQGGLPVLSGFSPRKATAENRMTTEERLHRHRQIVNSDLAPARQSVLSKLGQFSTTADTIDDTDESEGQPGTESVRGSALAASSGAPAPALQPTTRAAATLRMAEGPRSFLTEASEESYSSIPLLDRGLTDDGHSRGAPTEWGNHSVLEDANDSGPQTPTLPAVIVTGHDGAHRNSYQMVERTDSIKKIHPGDTMPRSPAQATDMSFFDDDESDHASDLSSEMSAEDEEDQDLYSQAARNPADPTALSCRLPPHPLGDPQRDPPAPAQVPLLTIREQHPGRLVEDSPLGSHPPSPPMTLVQALQMSPDTAKIPEVHDYQLWEDKPLPPTPGDAGAESGKTKKQRQQEAEMLDAIGMQPMVEQRQKTQPRTAAGLEAARKFSVHLPFILAFESEILAQQFTLIEKDALHEIDWKELIEMRWKNAENSNARSWVDFLRNTDARGVEVVIARFNIMVKWTVSEVILTQDMEERARCLIKFIHIAAHCRRYRNYATMSQITIALSSNEVGRLSQTWAMVPASDVSTLRDLESLVLPTRNFYSLRAEMEAVDIDNAESGCIPFVGIYTHDLLFNAQRPSEIASSPTTAPLVNFERCRVAASIVKTLLRLVEASALYNFQPVEGITERCLWMSALSDDDIRKFSEVLE